MQKSSHLYLCLFALRIYSNYNEFFKFINLGYVYIYIIDYFFSFLSALFILTFFICRAQQELNNAEMFLNFVELKEDISK